MESMDTDEIIPEVHVSRHGTIKVAIKDTSLEKLKSMWRDMPERSRIRFKEDFGEIASIMTIQPDWDALRGLVYSYNSDKRCFSFDSFDLCPTIEEYRRMLGIPFDATAYMPREMELNPSVRDAKSALSGCLRIPPVDLKPFLRTTGATSGLLWNLFYDRNRNLVGTSSGLDVKIFSLGLFGLVLFPSTKEYVYSAVITLLHQMERRRFDFAPAILAETLRELKYVRDKGKGQFKFCVQMLTMWLHSHLEENASMFPSRSISDPVGRFNTFMREKGKQRSLPQWRQFFHELKEEEVTWAVKPFTATRYLQSCGNFAWVPLVGIRGIISYAPALVARQLCDKQDITNLTDLGKCYLSYQGLGSKDELLKFMMAWEQPHFKKAVYGDVHPGYQNWRSEHVLNEYEPMDIDMTSATAATVREQDSTIRTLRRQVEEMKDEARRERHMSERIGLERETRILKLEADLHSETKAKQKLQRENELLEDEARDTVILEQRPVFSSATWSRKWASMKCQLIAKRRTITRLNEKARRLKETEVSLRVALDQNMVNNIQLANLDEANVQLTTQLEEKEREFEELTRKYAELDHMDSCLHTYYDNEKKKVAEMRSIMSKNYYKATKGLEVAEAIYHDSSIALRNKDLDTSIQRHAANLQRLKEFYHEMSM